MYDRVCTVFRLHCGRWRSTGLYSTRERHDCSVLDRVCLWRRKSYIGLNWMNSVQTINEGNYQNKSVLNNRSLILICQCPYSWENKNRVHSPVTSEKSPRLHNPWRGISAITCSAQCGIAGDRRANSVNDVMWALCRDTNHELTNDDDELWSISVNYPNNRPLCARPTSPFRHYHENIDLNLNWYFFDFVQLYYKATNNENLCALVRRKMLFQSHLVI